MMEIQAIVYSLLNRHSLNPWQHLKILIIGKCYYSGPELLSFDDVDSVKVMRMLISAY